MFRERACSLAGRSGRSRCSREANSSTCYGDRFGLVEMKKGADLVLCIVCLSKKMRGLSVVIVEIFVSLVKIKYESQCLFDRFKIRFFQLTLLFFNPRDVHRPQLLHIHMPLLIQAIAGARPNIHGKWPSFMTRQKRSDDHSLRLPVHEVALDDDTRTFLPCLRTTGRIEINPSDF